MTESENRKKVLIIFPDHWLAYSPTVTNIFEILSERYDVQVVAVELMVKNKAACIRVEDQNVSYVRFPKIPRKIWTAMCIFEEQFNKILGRRFCNINFFRILQAWILYKKCKKIEADVVIGVDAVGFYVAQKIFTCAHVVSLEISTDDFFYRKMFQNAASIQSLIIQSRERLHLLNLLLKPEQKVIIAQNAPVLREEEISPEFNSRFIYLGSGNLTMGIKFLFDYFSHYPKHSLTFKGLFDAEYIYKHFPHVKNSKNIEFDDAFVSNRNVQKYLAQFSIGFCFYDFAHVAESAKQNMLHGPSGKVFNYFAAKLPIIASDIPGFQMIKEYGAGILLKDPTPENIDDAVENIRSNYKEYSDNALKAAKDFCFKKSFMPFVNHVEAQFGRV